MPRDPRIFYKNNHSETISIYHFSLRISLCGRQEELADYSWSAALYKLYSKVFPESVHLLWIPLFCVLLCMECDKAKVLVLSLRSV